MTLRGPRIAEEFRALVLDYIEKRYGRGAVETPPLAVEPVA